MSSILEGMYAQISFNGTPLQELGSQKSRLISRKEEILFPLFPIKPHVND